MHSARVMLRWSHVSRNVACAQYARRHSWRALYHWHARLSCSHAARLEVYRISSSAPVVLLAGAARRHAPSWLGGRLRRRGPKPEEGILCSLRHSGRRAFGSATPSASASISKASGQVENVTFFEKRHAMQDPHWRLLRDVKCAWDGKGTAVAFRLEYINT